MRRRLRSRKALVKDLDKYFSLYIRQRDGKLTDGMCIFACGRPIECAFHVVTRSKFAVRWDPFNCVGSCNSCNFNNEFNPDPYRIAYIKHYGWETYEALVERSNTTRKFERTDLMALIEEYRGKVS